MADNNYSNASRQDDLAQDDPFAELTRIMGHDPRPAPHAPVEQPVDDLALELENELLGDLDDGESGGQELDGLSEITNEQQFYGQADDGQEANPGFTAPSEPADLPEPERDAAFEASLDQAFAANEEVLPSWNPWQGDFGAAETDGTPQGFSDGTEQEPIGNREEDFAALDSDYAMPGGMGSDDMAAGGQQPVQAAADAAEAPFASYEPERGPEEAQLEEVFEQVQPDMPRPDIFTAADAAAARYQQFDKALEPGEDQAWEEALHAAEEQAQEASGGAFGDWSPEQVFLPESAIDTGSSHPEISDPVYETPAVDSSGTDNLPPTIETVDLPEQAVALADDLDIPEVTYREEVRPAAELDEIDELLAGAFGEAGDLAEASDDGWKETTPAAGEAPSVADDDEKLDEFLAAGIAAGLGVAATSTSVRAASEVNSDDLNGDFAETYSRGWSDVPEANPAMLTPSPGVEPPADGREKRFGSLWSMAAAVVGGVVILGGVTVFALTFSGGESGGPVLVKADSDPVKVQPQDPGGTVIPNQDNPVYKRVSGEAAGDARPAQTQLVSTAEEPVDLPGVSTVPDDTTVASSDDAQKLGDRLYNPVDAAAGNENTPPSLAPRRVRSLVVRPDGTMVPHSMPQPQEATARSGTQQLSAAPTGSGTGASLADTVGEGSEAEAAGIPIPDSAPIPPSRPANIASARTQENAPPSSDRQPDSAQTQVAAVQPPAAEPAAAVSPWSVQIASQPSAQEAQQSYQELAQRYGNLLQGKGVNIVKAEIADRGTFYRVRIPSSSKDEAVQLCSQLKSAGGNCFVSQ